MNKSLLKFFINKQVKNVWRLFINFTDNTVIYYTEDKGEIKGKAENNLRDIIKSKMNIKEIDFIDVNFRTDELKIYFTDENGKQCNTIKLT